MKADRRDGQAVPPRLFIALWPASAAREALAADLEAARTNQQALWTAVRWQPPDRWHTTLAFLGPAAPERVVAKVDGLMARPGVPRPSPVRLSRFGTFGPVVWVGVDHGPWLGELAHLLQRRLRTDDHRFRAHVTVGRVRGPAAPRRAKEAAAGLPTHDGPEWTPHEFTLLESRIGPEPQYRVHAWWPLGAPNRGERAAPDDARPGGTRPGDEREP